MLHLFENVGTLGYALNALAYLVLSILLLVSWKKRLLGGLLLVAVIYEVLWSVVLAYHSATLQLPALAVEITGNLRLIIWVAFLLEVLRSAANAITNKRIFLFSY
ncbi:MAG: hypothetical protein P8047_16605, partial [Gammaproteobacteria bacterium]